MGGQTDQWVSGKIQLFFHGEVHVIQCERLWRHLRDISNRNTPGGTYYVTDEAQTPAGITKAIMKGENVVEVSDPDQILERITWSPWNLVEGPEGTIRTDDKGNFHDQFSTVRGGLTHAQRADLQAADRLQLVDN